MNEVNKKASNGITQGDMRTMKMNSISVNELLQCFFIYIRLR